jgi:pimeloyl-ACP methyl ester carboxylesterase
MTTLRRVLLAVLLLCAGAYVGLRTRDPERLAMDHAARRGVAGRQVRLPDGVTHYDVAGPDSGARVVLVHGFSVPSYIWDSTVVALAGAGFRVARYDTYGRGWSDRPDVRYDFDLYDRQLAGLLDSLGWRGPVHLVGLSYGGPIAATFVGRHPERARTLTLLDPAAGTLGALPPLFAAPGVGSVLWQGIAVPKMADGQTSDFVQPARWPDWADRYRVWTRYRGFGRALRRTREAGRGVLLDTLFATAGRTARPTLLVWGEEDRTVPIARSAQLRAAIPQAEFHPIPRAGHLPHIERADVVNPLLVGFLRAH